MTRHQRQAVRCRVEPDQGVHLQRQAHQQRRQEEQTGACVANAYSTTNRQPTARAALGCGVVGLVVSWLWSSFRG